jgi:thiamine phosphate synthase YjbQ (UPF0047 family)
VSVHSAVLRFRTHGHGHIVDVTEGVASVVGAAGVQQGIACVAARGSTVAVTTMEYEPGGVHDLTAALERLIPTHGEYEHNRLNHDTNSHAHMRAAVIGRPRPSRWSRAGSRSGPGSRSYCSTSTIASATARSTCRSCGSGGPQASAILVGRLRVPVWVLQVVCRRGGVPSGAARRSLKTRQHARRRSPSSACPGSNCRPPRSRGRGGGQNYPVMHPGRPACVPGRPSCGC